VCPIQAKSCAKDAMARMPVLFGIVGAKISSAKYLTESIRVGVAAQADCTAFSVFPVAAHDAVAVPSCLVMP